MTAATAAAQAVANAAAAPADLVQTVDWTAVAPPVIAAAVALLVLVADLFVPPERRRLLGWAAIAGLAAAMLALLPLRAGDRSTFCLTTDPATCSYTADHFTLAVQFLVLGGALLTALLSLTETAPGRRGESGLPAGEYWFLLLSSTAGTALLPASRDLATLVVALEVASLPAFALVGLRRGDRLSGEAALKFFLSSVTATAVTLLGASFVYAVTGTLHLTGIAEALPDAPDQLATLATAGVALTLVGFAFKTAAVPFHFWVPDTYAGAPLPVAAYLSVVGKAVGFTGLVLVAVVAFPAYADVWGPALAVLAALTMTAGNLAALRQSATRALSAVRLLAWSSVGQAGYLLVPVAAAAYTGAAAIGSTIAYALMYAVVNLGAFTVVALVARTRPAKRIADFRGLYAARPGTALAMAFFLLCLAGLPPGIIGLFAKVTVFSAAVDAGLGWLAAIMAVNVVLGLYYYLRWTAVLFRAPAPAASPEPVLATPAGPGNGASATAAAPGNGALATAGNGTLATAPAPASTPPKDSAAPVPLPLAAALVLTTVAAVALSGYPQLILTFAARSLF
ncbi:NADH-quinone oxidoreductase subunit N [Streptomyces solincola]|uniref:NADH-quinone oxidoreductase subunit N n=1 Tax=Streptomyces solincola TaxID=2100817 RepID=A0A2S9Q2L7_9ACTN|nr:NADH-quinone oxidoreductase subunit N [Streptomyces solincola]PRH80911.1 NADH-quinone oxidoreductase subunit N [Streptomyces solincola]